MVFLLYELLEANRNAIIVTLSHRIPREVRAYSRVPRRQLKESIDHIYDALLDRIASGSDENLKRVFTYIARARSAQSFPMSAVLRALMCAGPVIRTTLQRDCRQLSEEGPKLFNQAMGLLDQLQADAVSMLVDCFHECNIAKKEEHHQYLKDLKGPSIDLSRLVVFRG